MVASRLVPADLRPTPRSSTLLTKLQGGQFVSVLIDGRVEPSAVDGEVVIVGPKGVQPAPDDSRLPFRVAPCLRFPLSDEAQPVELLYNRCTERGGSIQFNYICIVLSREDCHRGFYHVTEGQTPGLNPQNSCHTRKKTPQWGEKPSNSGEEKNSSMGKKSQDEASYRWGGARG